MGVKGGRHYRSAKSVVIADFREENSRTGEEQMEGRKGVRYVSAFVVFDSEPLSFVLSTRDEVADVPCSCWSEIQSLLEDLSLGVGRELVRGG